MRAPGHVAAAFLLSVAVSSAADRAAIRAASEAARTAHGKKDWPAMLRESQKVAALLPQSATALYNLACAQSLAGRKAEALASLNRLADYGVRFDLAAEADFAPIRNSPEFEAVLGRMQAVTNPLGSSAPAFTLPQRDLLPEGIAHDPQTGAFFVSSVHRRKVLRVAPDATVTDFVPEGQDGLLSAMALAADPNRRSLYVWSEGKAQTKGLGKDGQGRSEVLEFDLDSARLRRRLSPAVAGGGAGDLTVGPDGSLFVADPRTGRVDMLRPGKDALEVLVEAGPLLSPQGMAVSSDRRVLFVADYAQGVARVDLETREVAFLPAPESVLVTGIDGLVRAGDSLVAIQNGLPPHRVARLRMDPAGTRIMSGEILERASPHFDEPTLGVLVGSDLYYVANSQYEAFDKDGRPDEARLKNPVILKLRLQWVEGR